MENKNNQTPIEYIIIPGVLLILIAIVGYFFIKESNKLNQQQQIQKERNGVLDTDLLKDGKTIIWAGYYGENPRFISKGPMRGFGWAENPIIVLKKSLEQDYGIRILSSYMTPSRMEFDFNEKKRPICSYPYMFKDPKNEFSTKVKFLYSKPLEFSGEKLRKIIFPKEHRSKFIKHLNEKGDINITSLLEDNSLKTTIIKDKDLGDAVSAIQENDGQNQRKIKDKYKKYIKMMVASDNMQLLKMMKGQRFDYSFDSYFTATHFIKAKIDPSEFDSFTYENESISSAYDKNLVFSVVRCTDHPVTRKIMPVINKIIYSYRHPQLGYSFDKYREKVDEGYRSIFINSLDTLGFRLTSFITSGEIDWWYKDYEKQLLFAPQSITPIRPIKKSIPPNLINRKIAQKNKKIEYSIYSKNNRLIILEKSDDVFDDNQRILSYRIEHGYNIMDRQQIIFHLNQKDISILNNANKINTPIEKIEGKILDQTKYLTISAANISYQSVLDIIRKTPNLLGFIYLFPARSTPNDFLKLLPANLEELGLVRMELKENGHQLLEKFNKLNYFDISATNINESSLLDLLHRNSTSLKFFKFAHQKIITTEKLMQDFSLIDLHDLRYLDLAGNLMGYHVTNPLTQSIVKMKKLEYLNIEGSIIHPENTKMIFKTNKNLKTFIAPYNFIVSNKATTDKLILPDSLEHLIMKDTKLSNKDLENIIFNTTLKTLDLNENNLGDTGVYNLIKKLPKSLSSLNLSNSKNSNEGIIKVLKELEGFDLREIILNNAKIKDNNIFSFLQKNKNLESIEFEGNLLTDNIINTINKLKHLKKINLNQNFLAKPMINSPNLKQLNISTNFINRLDCLKALHNSGLTNINLTNNRINHLEIINFLSNIPHLQKISFGSPSQTWSSQDSFYLQKIDTSNFNYFNNLSIIEVLNAHSEIVKGLPEQLRFLSLANDGNLISGFRNDKQREIHYPKNLDSLRMVSVPNTKNFIKLILPNNLSILYLQNGLDETFFDMLMEKSKKEFILDIRGSAKESADLNLVGDYGHAFFPKISPVSFMLALTQNSKMTAINVGITEGPIKKLNFQRKVKSNLRYLRISGKIFDDDFASFLNQNVDLKRVEILNLGSTTVTHKGIIQMIKAVNPQLVYLGIQSTKLRPEGLDELIQSLPKNLITLIISGNQIGELGLMKFRQWQKEQSSQIGVDVNLIE